MRLIPNWPAVLARASSLWAVYGGLFVLLVDKAPGWLKSDAAAHFLSPEWREILLGLCLIAAPVLRIIQQRSISGDPPPPHPLTKE